MTIFDTRRFLLQKIKEANPNIESRSGSAVGTMLVKPLSVMISPFSEEIDFIKTQLSLADVASLSTDNVDQLITNLFIDRRIGGFATGSVRIFYSSAQDSLVPQGTGFISILGNLYLAINSVSLSQAEMSLNRDGSLFFMDVPIIASDAGDEFNAEPNEIVSTETDIIGSIRVTNPNRIVNGLDTETDEEFVERAQLAITVRNLINRRSVSTVLLNNFNFLVSLQPIGFRDPEMIRDLVLVGTSLGDKLINIGGHADIYIEPTSTTEATVEIPDTAMIGELTISTNENRGLVSESVKAGLYIDIAPGFFGEIEVKEQFGIELNPTSTYYIYLDIAGVLQLDDVSGFFPSNSIPLAIVTTGVFDITSVADSRVNVISFPRPMVSIDSVFELDPVALTPTERILSDGRTLLANTSTESSVTEQCNMAVSVTDIAFVACLSNGSVTLSSFSESGTLTSIVGEGIIDAGLGVSRNPTISIDPLGKIHIIFENDDAGQFDIYHTRLTQAGVAEVATASVSGVTAGVFDTRHDLDETGNIHIAWAEGVDIKYMKLDNSAASIITPTVISGASTLAKATPDISTNGNTVATSATGRANGNTTFNDFTTPFPGAVAAGQTLVLTGGTLDFSAILDGTETEPPPFAATITGTVSGTTFDTSIASGYNTFEVVVDGVTVDVSGGSAFTNSPVNPIATVIAEINAVSNATILATNVAFNSGSDEIQIISPTTGVTSTISVTVGNNGIGLALGANDQGGAGYDTTIVNGTNTLDLTVDDELLNVVFTDVKGNSLANVLTEINTVSLASPLAASVAFDGGGFVRIISPSTGLASDVVVTLGNSALGFITGTREEGGTELGRRIGISIVVGVNEITLAEALRAISTSDDISYRIEAVESGIVWTEDSDIFIAKIDDVPSIFVTATNLTKVGLQASQLAVPAVDALSNGPGVNEITLDDTTGLFITNGIAAGDTVRVITATPSSAEADYKVKQVNSEVELILTGTLPSSPANTVTYEIFETHTNTQPRIDNNTDNEAQIFWVLDAKNIGRIEIDRIGVGLSEDRSLSNRPKVISYLDIYTDSSDSTHVGWVESSFGSGDPHMMKVDEFGDIVLDEILLSDLSNVARFFNIESNTENEPITFWVDTDFSLSTTSPITSLTYQRRSAQDYYIKVNDPAVNMSVKEDRSIIFTKEFIGQPIGVTYQTSPEVQTIEDYIQLPDNQIIDSNYLTKHALRAFVSISINYSGEVENAQQTVIDFINGVNTKLEASDISDALYEAGATQVELPFTMKVEYTDIDGTFRSLSDEDELTIPRVARYFADSSRITVTNVE
jgi:hypothetical protein